MINATAFNDNAARLYSQASTVVASSGRAIHNLFALPVWRGVLTLASCVTTVYGLMLLYNSLLGGQDHSVLTTAWFLKFLIPFAVGGALHTAIFHILGLGSATGRAKYFAAAAPLQILAILASFGTHWLVMMGNGQTVGAFQDALDATERGIVSFDQSFANMADAMTAVSARSGAEAAVEQKGAGDSCGTAVGSGKGPRYDLRMADRNTFTQLNTQVQARKLQIDAFVQRAQAMTAGSADEAMSRLAGLHNLVDEAKARFESDPLTSQIRTVAEARIALGKGPIPIPQGKRGASGAATFTCYDTELAQRLQAIIAALDNIKPLPEVQVPDFRDANVGVPFAWSQLGALFGSLDVWPRSREQLQADRTGAIKDALSPRTAQQLPTTPLMVATAIELFLSLVFFLGRDPLARNPGMEKLAAMMNRRDDAVFDRVWRALGGSAVVEAVRRMVDAYSMFEKNCNWVFVPLYGEDEDVRVLHVVMEMLVAVHMARRVHAGRGLMARWYMNGWDPARKARLSGSAVRVYRMTAREYLAFSLDALRRSDVDGPAPSDRRFDGNVSPIPPVSRRRALAVQ
jgi:hypothetical protein